ncbi:MAG: putative nucleotidyltransferase with HDIG domain [Candidatus Latescibacterota bacterium]|jgi:putative nucleotidyltransferase with HDIG domain
MPKIKVIALEGNKERTEAIKNLIEGADQYDFVSSNSPRQLMNHMDGKGEVKLIITNTTISRDEQDGVKFIKALYLKYQRYKVALPPILVCSAEQRGQIVRLYAYRFSDLALVYYVLLSNEDLSKNGSKLLDIMGKALTKRETLENRVDDEDKKHVVIKKRMKNLLKKTVALPSVPDVAIHVQNAMKDPEVSFEKLSKIINQDLTLAANMVKLANSPQYGVSGKINTIDDACKQVGLNAIANTIMATKVFDAVETLPSDFDVKALRKHSYAVATIARVVARRCHALGKTQERISFSGAMFAAGLLHDIGKVLMVEYFTEEINDIIAKAYAEDCSMVKAETDVLGINHADAGLHAGMEWQFPVLLVNVIGRHHWPLDQILPRLKTKQGRLAQRVIRIADAASYALGYGMLRSDGRPPKLREEYFEKTGLTKKEFEKWTPEIRDDIAYTFEALGGV